MTLAPGTKLGPYEILVNHRLWRRDWNLALVDSFQSRERKS